MFIVHYICHLPPRFYQQKYRNDLNISIVRALNDSTLFFLFSSSSVCFDRIYFKLKNVMGFPLKQVIRETIPVKCVEGAPRRAYSKNRTEINVLHLRRRHRAHQKHERNTKSIPERERHFPVNIVKVTELAIIQSTMVLIGKQIIKMYIPDKCRKAFVYLNIVGTESKKPKSLCVCVCARIVRQ